MVMKAVVVVCDGQRSYKTGPAEQRGWSGEMKVGLIGVQTRTQPFQFFGEPLINRHSPSVHPTLAGAICSVIAEMVSESPVAVLVLSRHLCSSIHPFVRLFRRD